jgi:hypothetical protein
MPRLDCEPICKAQVLRYAFVWPRMRFGLSAALLFSFSLCVAGSVLAQPRGVVAEPFRMLATDVIFAGDEVEPNDREREKIVELARRIFHTYTTPVHQCDFDVFVYEGLRRFESGLALERLDRLFVRRVSHLKSLLADLGVPENVGVTIRPSESRPLPEAIPDSVSISVRYWIHQKGEKYEPNHLECKWPQPLRR